MAVIQLGIVLFVLAAAGAGIFPWTLFLSAILLSASALAALVQSCPQFTPRSLRSPVFLLLLYALLMLLPLRGCTYRLSPRRMEANQIAQSAHASLQPYWPDVPSAPTRYALTRNRTGTLRFLLLSTAGLAAWLILRSARHTLRERWLLGLLLLATAMALTGVAGKWFYPQGDTLYWYLHVPHGRPGPMGGFINRNHFAGFMALLAPAALALGTTAWAHKRRLKALCMMASAGILALSVLLSLSRGGTLALVTGLLAATAMLLRKSPLRHQRLALVCAALVAGACALLVFQVPAIRQRMTDWRHPSTTESVETRWHAWQDSLAIARAYPLLGAGPNAFRTVFPQHRLSSERAARDFAENEYVQWMAETGAVGLLLAALFLIKIGVRIVRARGGLSDTGALQAAATGALAAAMTHALVDFPLRLPLYAITLAALAALLWPAPSPDSTPRPACVHVASMGTMLLLAIILLPADLRLDAPSRMVSAAPNTALRALHAAPTYPIVWRRLAALLWDPQDSERRQMSVSLLSQAADYDPNHYVLWRLLGDRRLAIGDREGAAIAYQRVRDLRDWVKVPILEMEE